MREKQHSRDSDRKRALRTTSRRAGSLACRSRGVRGGIEPPAPQLVGRWQEPAVIRAMLGEISRAAGVLPNRCHGPPRCPRAPSALRPKTIDFQPLPMRPSGLEPPRGNLPTRPSTSFKQRRCVRGRPDRPISGGFADTSDASGGASVATTLPRRARSLRQATCLSGRRAYAQALALSRTAGRLLLVRSASR